MADRTCENCGRGFWQGQGRPAKRCPPCRGEDRYGAEHRATRAATIDQAVGQLCARCQTTILEGQPVDLDHADNGQGYLGYSHRSCNASAGASRGNALRAAAYRAAMGLPARSTVAANGASRPRARVAAAPTPVCQRTREEIMAEAKTTGQGLPCLCGRITSRCW
jgi:hypothetical protein